MKIGLILIVPFMMTCCKSRDNSSHEKGLFGPSAPKVAPENSIVFGCSWDTDGDPCDDNYFCAMQSDGKKWTAYYIESLKSLTVEGQPMPWGSNHTKYERQEWLKAAIGLGLFVPKKSNEYYFENLRDGNWMLKFKEKGECYLLLDK